MKAPFFSVLLLGAALTALGCSDLVLSSMRYPAHRCHGQRTEADIRRMPPGQRWEREIVACFGDTWAARDANRKGTHALEHPLQRRIGTAWTFVSLGLDYEEQGDLGGASRAFWSALEIAPDARASRPARERVNQTAFEGLARVAKARGQHTWSELLSVCAALPTAYLASNQASHDGSEWDGAVEELKKAENDASWKETMMYASFAAQSGAMVAGRVSGAVSESDAQRMSKDVGGQIKPQEEARKKLNSMSHKVGQALVQAADDLPDVVSGNRFVAERVLFYVTATDDAARYLDALHSRLGGAGWAPLRQALEAVGDRAKPTEAELLALVAALNGLETDAVKRERFRVRYAAPGGLVVNPRRLPRAFGTPPPPGDPVANSPVVSTPSLPAAPAGEAAAALIEKALAATDGEGPAQEQRAGCRKNARECLGLASTYLFGGLGVTKDTAIGFALFDRLCADGDEVGCSVCSTMLWGHSGFAPDRERLTAYAARGCALGGAASCRELSSETSLATAAEKLEAIARLRRWCDEGGAKACGTLMSIGTAAEKADVRARVNRLCDQSDADACAYVQRIPGADPSRDISGGSWVASAVLLRGKGAGPFTFECPPGGTPDGGVWGTDVYTNFSTVCSAAVHAGKITAKQGGTVRILLRGRETAFVGSERNGVASAEYGPSDDNFAFE